MRIANATKSNIFSSFKVSFIAGALCTVLGSPFAHATESVAEQCYGSKNVSACIANGGNLLMAADDGTGIATDSAMAAGGGNSEANATSAMQHAHVGSKIGSTLKADTSPKNIIHKIGSIF